MGHAPKRWLAAAGAVSLAAAAVIAPESSAFAAGPTTSYVSVSGFCQGHKASTTITAAVLAAPAGSTIRVCPGTYAEDVVVVKPLTILGWSAEVAPSASDTSPIANPNLPGNNAFTVLAPHVTIKGFTVSGATGDGIFIAGDHAVVEHVLAQGNGSNGINLDGSSWSTVADNTVTADKAGIELANDIDAAHLSLPGVTGTATYDWVANNIVVNNPGACGIYLVDHAGSTTGVNLANGVHDNTVRGNTVLNNALAGYGGGILMASEVPGGAVYNNTVADNTIAGNFLSGVFLHSHLPGQDLNGNVIEYNNIGTNNLSTMAEPNDGHTTAIFVGTHDPLSITITGNALHDDYYGIFSAGPVQVTRSLNSYTTIAHPFGSVPAFTG